MTRTVEFSRIAYRNAQGYWHRKDGPAVIYIDGRQFWCKNGELHREDGPAVIYPGGNQFWYKEGVRYDP